ncbi:antibiotic biosynthesis monooxygenase [Nocardia sp. SYP-A9097]|uniref:antibiotic biosynthesis monooxygenase n=1 Tax=Nocardia sp. SYP-A9097 TaxID=2663237 RepID=UPI00129B0E99|nr:antibiotic biosynthesis monooxygenase [Nocardia sp. SYP-A9097]MRH87714.1 antibiotic biosynthesis monooxygenase [Nocardia sp. SYP-A9097]
MTDTEVTSIDIFETPHADTDGLIDSWQEFGESLSAAPGFRTACLHRAIQPETRFAVTDFALWDGLAQAESALGDPTMAMTRAAAAATAKANPAVYEVVAEASPPK